MTAEAARLSHMPLPDPKDHARPHWLQQVRFLPAVYALLLEEHFAARRNLDVRYHTPVTAADADADRVQLRAGSQKFRAAMVVDATGDALVAALAGGTRLGGPARQPGTPIFRLGGYRFEALDIARLEAEARAAVAAGDLRRDDLGIAGTVANILAAHGDNTIHVPMREPYDRSRSEIDARRAVWRLFRFLRSRPGLEKLTLEYLAPSCGIRESFVIEGETTITCDDYLSGRSWPDAVCHSFYPIDLHIEGDAGLDCRPLAEGVAPSVPARALMLKGFPRLLTAGRCISSDRLANSALRVQATCMATGQAAGAIAALAAKDDRHPGELAPADIAAELRRHGAIVPENIP